MLERVNQAVIDWADGFGLVGLAVVSATEAALQPVPPDLLVLPMSLNAEGPLELLLIFVVATLSSVLGSLGGYAIGAYGGRPALDSLARPTTVVKLEALTAKYGDAGVFIAAISPIPYKVMAWTAGAGKMNLRLFIAAGLVGRSIRFGLEVIILGFWGDEFLNLLKSPWTWLFVGVISLLIFVPLISWWSGLGSEGEYAE